MSHLCVAIFVHDVAQAKRDIAAAAEAGANMVELRLDYLTDAHEAQTLVRDSILPCIVTCRPTWEGGYSELSSEDRIKLLLAACGGQTRYIDLELRTFRETTFNRPQSAQFIISSHEFTTRPPRLYQLITELIEIGGAVNKIVWAARSIRDNIEAMEILKNRSKPMIALCMG